MANKNTNKKASVKAVEAVPQKPKKKGSVLMYIAVGFIIGALILAFYFGVINTAAEKGTLKIITSNESIIPVSHTVKEVTGGNETVYPFWEIDAIDEELPKITFESEFYLSYDGKTREDFAFFMYYEDENTGDIKSVYENVPYFEHPKDEEGNIIPGTYTVKLKFSWGSNDKNYITEENFFKIIYN